MAPPASGYGDEEDLTATTDKRVRANDIESPTRIVGIVLQNLEFSPPAVVVADCICSIIHVEARNNGCRVCTESHGPCTHFFAGFGGLAKWHLPG